MRQEHRAGEKLSSTSPGRRSPSSTVRPARSTGRLDYAAAPVRRAVQWLTEDPIAVLVVNDEEQKRRGREELARRPELAEQVEREGRLLEATRAYEERHRWREQWREGNRDMP